MTTMTELDSLKLTALPPAFVDELAAIRAATVDRADRLMVCVVGAFAVGKSALLNMLIGREVLPVAPEESTAVPTFLQFGPAWRFSMSVERDTGLDGVEERSDQELTEPEFQRLALEGTATGSFLTVEAPCEWLHDLYLIDLPGTGGNDLRRRDLATAQIRRADVVLYLLPPRGPAADDLRLIHLAATLGKRLAVFVARWDEAERAHRERGEPLPPLAEWSQRLAEAAGRPVALRPCSRDGLGRTDILEALEDATGEREAIRAKAYVELARCLARRAVQAVEDHCRALEATDGAAVDALRDDLQQTREQIVAASVELGKCREAARGDLDRTLGQVRASALTELQGRLDAAVAGLGDHLAAPIDAEQAWAAFMGRVRESMAQVTLAAAQQAEALNRVHGVEATFEIAYGPLHVGLPSLPSLALEDFIQAGEDRFLEARLLETMAEIADGERQLTADIPAADQKALLTALRELQAERGELSRLELPVVVERLPAGNTGRVVGQLLGEAADLALLFVNPTTAGAKVASLLGKGAKTAKTASQALKTTQAAVKAAKGLKGGKLHPALEQVMEKASYLEVLSCSYWGERLGACFDGPDTEVASVDPAALAQQRELLDKNQAQIAAYERELDAVRRTLDDREATTYMLEAQRKKAEQLEQMLTTVRAKQCADAEAERTARWRKFAEDALVRARQAGTRCRADLEQQLFGMERLAKAAFQEHWHNRVDEALAVHRAHLASLEADLGRDPEARTADLGRLRLALAVLREELAGFERATA